MQIICRKRLDCYFVDLSVTVPGCISA